MSQPTQVTPTTKDVSSKALSEKPTNPHQIPDTPDLVYARVVQAAQRGEKYVETTPEVMTHFMGEGYKSPYFLMKDIRVCKAGDIERCEATDGGTAEDYGQRKFTY